MTYEEAIKEVAIKHKLGTTLVTGHKASYFKEAAELYAEQFKMENKNNELNIDILNGIDNLDFTPNKICGLCTKSRKNCTCRQKYF